MKKCKIFFALNTLNCGGIEKAAVSLLSSLNPEYCDVTLSIDRDEGTFRQFVPSWVKICPIPYSEMDMQERSLGAKKFIIRQICNLKIMSAIRSYMVNMREHRLTIDGRRIARAKRFYKNAKNNTTYYDLAVAFADLEELIYVSKFIKAKRKITWFHTQYDSKREDLNQYTEFLDSYDSFYCVSNSLLDSMKCALPDFSERMYLYPHIIQSKTLKACGDSIVEWPKGEGLKILSVGRLAYQKGFDLVPEIASELLERGCLFTWYIIGDGPQREFLTEKIKEKGLETKIYLMGELSNPYPFFNSCDIYVQPSRYEGFCLTLAEAKIFHKPIVTTIFDGSQEQIVDHKTGTIVSHCNVSEITNAISELCSNSQLRDSYSTNLKNAKLDNLKGVDIFMEEVYKSYNV